MKKILSLIVLLVVTLTAFAQSTSEKIIPDGTQPNGGTITPKAITVDWATQKIVANVDLTNCLEGTNEQIFAISTNSADIANWEQESGSTLHFFYRQKFTEWGSTTTDVHKFAVQYRYKGDSGATNRFHVVQDISNCTIVMDKNGVTIDGTLVFEASLMPQLYKEGANQLYFGSLRGDHPYATYKSVELVTEEPAVEPVSYEFTHNADVCYYEKTGESGEDSQYNVYHQYIKDAKVMIENDKTGKYTATLKDVVAGKEKSALGDIVLAGLENEADGSLEFKLPTTLSFTVDVATSPFYGKKFTVVSGTIEATPAADAASKGVANVAISFADADGNMLTYMFNANVFIPVVQNFESNAYVKAGDEVTNYENVDAVLTEYMEGVYMVKFKKITLGTKTEDFTIENLNLKPTKDEDGNITFTTSDTSGFWNDADETELDFTDFSASVKEGENGFEGFVCKFTTENGQFVYGEKAETPDQPKDDYAINFDKDAKQTHSSRYSTSVSLQQTGKDKQTIEFGKTMNGYEDLTAGTKKFTVEAGSEVTPSIGYVGEWMHGYVYIDLNNDKQFSFNADGADQTGTEVVSYSYYKDQNSKGETASSNCNVNPMPAFTAPTEPGTYRIRFKVDWDNIDAGGSAVSGNHILNNGGGIYDATLEVVTPVVDGISTINAEAANGVQFFTVDGVKLSKLQKGLNIVRTADGKVKKVLVK